jgi:hypothetical protein
VSSGYGHGHEEPCCPLVVDPLCLLAILGGIAGATYFLQLVIAKTFGKKRRRRMAEVAPSLLEGYIAKGQQTNLHTCAVLRETILRKTTADAAGSASPCAKPLRTTLIRRDPERNRVRRLATIHVVVSNFVFGCNSKCKRIL